MADVASSSSRHNPFPVLTALPPPMNSVAVPSSVAMPWSDHAFDLRPLWDPATDSVSDIQLNVLTWLAHHSTAATKRLFSPADQYYVFTRSKHSPACFYLEPGSVCMSVRQRAFKAGMYSRVELGTRKGEDAGDKRIFMHAHRLVCCLTKGPPPVAGQVAKHVVCCDKSCINPEHLTWGTQQSNIRDWSGARVARRVAQAGASAALVLGAFEPGSCRAILRPF